MSDRGRKSRNGCGWYGDAWVGENLIDFCEIGCGGVLRIWPEVQDGHGEQPSHGGREQTGL